MVCGVYLISRKHEGTEATYSNVQAPSFEERLLPVDHSLWTGHGWCAHVAHCRGNSKRQKKVGWKREYYANGDSNMIISAVKGISFDQKLRKCGIPSGSSDESVGKHFELRRSSSCSDDWKL